MKILRIACIMVLILTMAVCAFAMEKRTAQIVSIDGSAEIKPAGQSSWKPASVGMVLNEGDTIKTASASWVLLNVDGKGQTATVEIKENSQMLLAELLIDPKSESSKTLLDLAMGEVLIKAQKVHGEKSKFEVKTPTSIVGVRGTTFNVKVEAVEE
ncbi:MAG: FecR family protein [Candidatus Omnitrophica bacterium]|nr:FecR family protein [Candidatus Omnitrophota bacterium]MCM8791522.1 FecR family protein [Candidatus Omnitrophota bacterium]